MTEVRKVIWANYSQVFLKHSFRQGNIIVGVWGKVSSKQGSFLSGFTIWANFCLIGYFSLSKDLVSLRSRQNYAIKGCKYKSKRNIHKLKKKKNPAHQLELISKSKQKTIIRITVSDIILKLLSAIVHNSGWPSKYFKILWHRYQLDRRLLAVNHW